MTSFPAQARRVHDTALPPQRRPYALRECTLHCAPYGFRATWHHLLVAARIPCTLSDDPDALVRAVDELQQARDVVLPRAQQYAAQRRVEKKAGSRIPRVVPFWSSWGWSGIAYCPDPQRHPTAPLATVVRTVLDRWSVGVTADKNCLVCGTPRRRPGCACPDCGVHPDGPVARWWDPSANERWRQIWRRDLDHHR